MNTIKNIVSIDMLNAEKLLGLRKMSSSCIRLSSATPWQAVAIKIPAKLTISEKVVNLARVFNAQLVFKTCEEIEDRRRKVFRCKTADGRYYLIGGNERPYPITTVTEVHPDNMVDSQLNEVTVSYDSVTKIPYIQ